MARFPIFWLSIDGQDVSNAFEPVLQEMTIKDSDGHKADTLSVDLNDKGGQIILPRVGAKVSAGLGWSDSGSVAMFDGTVDEVLSTGGRGQGHVLTISAKSADMRSKLKGTQEGHKDKSKFKDTAEAWAKKAGLKGVKMDEQLGQIERDYWSIANESFLTWGSRIAKELGATFKVMGDQAVFVSRSSGQAASGKQLATIRAAWGENLISWSLSPVLSRPEFKNFDVRWYDITAAKWMKESVQAKATGGNSAEATLTEKFKHPNKDHAKQRGGSNSAEADRDRGGGSVTIIGNPDAQSEAQCIVSGVRPGIDGSYRIATATHKLTRPRSYETTLDLKQPSGDAGADDRS